MIAPVGVAFTIAIVASLMLRRELLPWVLSAACCFSASLGFVIAQQNILVYYVVAIALIGSVLATTSIKALLTADLGIRPGLAPLIAFGLWSLTVTAVAPFVFAGTRVLNPRDGIDDGVVDPAYLTYQISNFAQSSYLVFGISIVVVVGTAQVFSPHAPAAGLALGTVLSSIKSLLPKSLQQTVFDNSPNVAYGTGSLNGVERMRGIFSEPAGLGGFSVTAAVFFVMTASRTQGWPRYLSLVLATWALVNASLSGSGTALVGGLLILAVIVAQAMYNYIVGISRVSQSAFVASVLAVPVGIIVGPALYASAAGAVGDKVDSSSYSNRTSANLMSLDLTWQTYGVGVGVGANRPSSFLAMLSSCTGLLGTVLFLVAIGVILWRAWRERSYQPAAWALVSLLFSKVVSGPDLSEPVMWFLIAVCARASWRGRGASEFDVSVQQRPAHEATAGLPRVRV